MAAWVMLLNIRSHNLLTLLERKTREFMLVKLPDKSAKSVMTAFETLMDE